MPKHLDTKYGRMRPNELGRQVREQMASDRKNGYSPALMTKVRKIIAQTPAKDYPVFFLRYNHSYRLELVSAPGGIVSAVDVINDDTNECFAGWLIDSEGLYQAGLAKAALLGRTGGRQR